MLKKSIYCSHPNCKLLATKCHPKHEDDGHTLCDFHHTEIMWFYHDENVDNVCLTQQFIELDLSE